MYFLLTKHYIVLLKAKKSKMVHIIAPFLLLTWHVLLVWALSISQHWNDRLSLHSPPCCEKRTTHSPQEARRISHYMRPYLISANVHLIPTGKEHNMCCWYAVDLSHLRHGKLLVSCYERISSCSVTSSATTTGAVGSVECTEMLSGT